MKEIKGGFYLIYSVIDGSESTPWQVTAKTVEKRKGFWRREVIDFHWVGGALADLLNADTELNKTLLSMEQTDIRIRPDKKHKCMSITAHPQGRAFALPAGGLFEAYDRIAGHVRRAMTL